MTHRRSPRSATVVGPDASPSARLSTGGTIAIAVTALAVRLLHIWQMRDTVFASVLVGDSRGYDAWAREIASGDWMGRDVFYQAPLYPYFLGVIYTIVGHDLLIVRILQGLLGAASAVALGYAASVLISARAGVVAGLMLALYPPAIFFDGLLQKSVLDVLFVCAGVAIIGRIIAGSQQRRWWVFLGLAMGALSLTRENALVLVAVVLVWAVTHRAQRRLNLSQAALVVAGLAAVLAPVAARNYAVGGGFYLTTSQLGSNLYIGNNPLADGSYMSLRAGRGSPEFERVDATALAEEASGRRLTPADVSSYWTGRTLSFIRAQPGEWLQLLGRKTRLLLSATEIIDTESQESHEEYSLALRVLGRLWHFGILAPIAVVGLWGLWPDRRRMWPIYAMAAGYAASVILFFVVARYRYPLVPFAILFAAAGLARGRDIVRGPRGRLLVVAFLALMVAVVANWPVYTADARRAITENNLGTALQEDGRAEEAVARYQRALTFDPAYGPALNNLGTALRATGRVDEALAAYDQALSLQGDRASVHYNMANALMMRGDTAAAIAQFRQALAANPRFVDAHNNLGRALEAEGRLDEAIASFRQAVAVDDRSAIAHANLGNALATAGVVREGSAELRRAIELAPSNPATHYDLGSLLLEAGSFAGAAAALRDALRLKPEYAEAHNNLGIALASQGQVALAVTHWREALRLKPGFADAQRNLDLAKPNR